MILNYQKAENRKKDNYLKRKGEEFETSVSTLLSNTSLFSRMIGPKGIKPYSVDNL